MELKVVLGGPDKYANAQLVQQGSVLPHHLQWLRFLLQILGICFVDHVVEELDDLAVVISILRAKRHLVGKIQRIRSLLGEKKNLRIWGVDLCPGFEERRVASSWNSVVVFWVEVE